MNKVVTKSLVVFFVSTALSWSITAIESSSGVPVTQTAEELQDWNLFYERYPEKESYTREEFSERQAAIDEIHDKHIKRRMNQAHLDTFLSEDDSLLFKREAVEHVMYLNFIVWLLITLLFRVPLTGSALISALLFGFTYLRLFLPSESILFMFAVLIGSTIYFTFTRLRSRNRQSSNT